MAHLSFYKQVRNDGGLRLGILLDGTSLWMSFTAGSGIDPSLLWYVDVEFTGDSLNGDLRAARALFVQYAGPIAEALEQVIDVLRLESDILVWPVSSREISLPGGLKLKAICSAIRKMRGRDLAQALAELRSNWKQHLDSLEPMREADQTALNNRR